MLYWKNKSLDSLTKDELRAAMADMIPKLLSNQPVNHQNTIFASFTLGAFFGLGTAFIAIFAAGVGF